MALLHLASVFCSTVSRAGRAGRRGALARAMEHAPAWPPSTLRKFWGACTDVSEHCQSGEGVPDVVLLSCSARVHRACLKMSRQAHHQGHLPTSPISDRSVWPSGAGREWPYNQGRQICSIKLRHLPSLPGLEPYCTDGPNGGVCPGGGPALEGACGLSEAWAPGPLSSRVGNPTTVNHSSIILMALHLDLSRRSQKGT